MTNYQNAIIKAASSEGVGSVYERVILTSLLPQLLKPLKIKTILEFPIKITKGWDNHALLDRYQVTLTAKNVTQSKSTWPFLKKPQFKSINNLKTKFDLVWNFAAVHQNPSLLSQMINLSNQYLLIFTPNCFNWGAPLHWGLHLLTLSSCQHPEYGPIHLMHKSGLKRFIKKHSLSIISSGYFDMPPWPDFAFSKSQLTGKPNSIKPNLKSLEQKISKSLPWEKINFPKPIKAVFAHHQYVLAAKS